MKHIKEARVQYLDIRKGPYGRNRSRVRGPVRRQICSDGTFDGVMEKSDETRCTRS